jgi:hypothetical protein
MYDIPFDRSFPQLSNGIRHVMPSTDTKPELTAKSSMAQPVSQPTVYANGLTHQPKNVLIKIKLMRNINLIRVPEPGCHPQGVFQIKGIQSDHADLSMYPLK